MSCLIGLAVQSHEPPARKHRQNEAVEGFLMFLRRIGKTRFGVI